MTQKIDMETPNVVAYELDHKLTKEEVERIHDDLRTAIGQSDKVRLYCDVTDLENVEPQAVIEDLKLTPEYISEIERFAIVGDENWHEWLTKATDVVTQGEARFFSPQDSGEARNWIRQ